MAITRPITDADFMRLKAQPDIQDIIVGIDIAEEQGDFETATSYYGILDSVIKKSSILLDRDNIRSLIINWITYCSKSIPDQYTTLTTFRNSFFENTDGDESEETNTGGSTSNSGGGGFGGSGTGGIAIGDFSEGEKIDDVRKQILGDRAEKYDINFLINKIRELENRIKLLEPYLYLLDERVKILERIINKK